MAVSYRVGAAAGLADLDEVLALGGLESYPYAHAARATMLDRLGRDEEAAASWRAAAGVRPDRRRAGVVHGPDDRCRRTISH